MSVQIAYNPVGGPPPVPTTLTLKRGPVNFSPYWEGRVHDNVSTSGAARERVVEHLDILIDCEMPHMVVGDDIEGWALFEAWALAGNPFCLFPCATLTDYYNCVLEDSDWKPARNAPKKYGAKLIFRILNDGQAPASPSVVLRRFYGLTG